MPRLLEFEKYEAVLRDGLPRAARYANEDGGESTHVLYLDAGAVRSMPAADWPPPLPSDPTTDEIAAALQAKAAAAAQRTTEAAQLRQQVLTIAQSAVGVRADQLTAVQLRALFLVVMWRTGALNVDLTVRPLRDWAEGG